MEDCEGFGFGFSLLGKILHGDMFNLTLLIHSYLAAALVKLLDKCSSGNDSRYNLVVCMCHIVIFLPAFFAFGQYSWGY